MPQVPNLSAISTLDSLLGLSRSLGARHGSSYCTLWHIMHFIMCNLETFIITLRSLTLKNAHIFDDLCHVSQNFQLNSNLKTIILVVLEFQLSESPSCFHQAFSQQL